MRTVMAQQQITASEKRAINAVARRVAVAGARAQLACVKFSVGAVSAEQLLAEVRRIIGVLKLIEAEFAES